MSFNKSEFTFVQQNFPNFELSYEIMTHKKVFNTDIILAIPEGHKAFAWFTNYNRDTVCFMLEVNSESKIINSKIIKVSFDDSLSLGTIFYGTIFTYNNTSCFGIEDIYLYKGKECKNWLYSVKLETLQRVLNDELSQRLLTNNHVLFGLPIMSDDFNILLKEIPLLPYKISQIKYRFFERSKSRKILCMKYYKPSPNKVGSYETRDTRNTRQVISKAVFKVTADIEPDIYNLFVSNNGTEEYYDLAFVSDYKTSVKMNQLFRNIKENANLDSIEESDDEEEFENKKEDRFVYLDRSFKMVCEYNYKFKRWCPLHLADENDKLSLLGQLPNNNR
jgi:hypothetical protein